MTDNDVIKVLDCCANGLSCEGCPLKGDAECCDVTREKALDLINRQKAKIELLEAELSYNAADYLPFEDKMTKLLKANESAKFEGAKSFADKLLALTEKQKLSHYETKNKNYPAGSPLWEFWHGRETEAEATKNRIKDLLKEMEERRIYGE